MLLDTGYVAHGTATTAAPSLDDLRAALIAAYPQVGPVFV
jgi:hypothetical protein